MATQSGTSRWIRRTPHRRYYLVDHRGIRRLDPEAGATMLQTPGLELYFT